MKKPHRTHRRLRRRRLTLLATFAAALVLASGGVAMTATGYAHLLSSARRVAPQPETTIPQLPVDWHPPGCVFPEASVFSQP